MPLDRFVRDLDTTVQDLERAGTRKGHEAIITGVVAPAGDRGPRYLLADAGDQPFIRMNSNSYLGLGRRPELIGAEEQAARTFGVGPGAVRFISGTYEPHVRLEARLAAFHGHQACMATSSAYTAMMSVVVSLTTPETVIVSDELNHNCIINAMRLARPKAKKVYRHLDLDALERQIGECVGQAESVLVITDGVFSMRGDYAPLAAIQEIIARWDAKFPRNIVLVVDDSHGVGAYGATGRGTAEVSGAGQVDILVATLGKAFGVNGGYITSDRPVIDFLREKNSFYIYTNPITPSEAAAAAVAVELADGPEGRRILERLSGLTARFEAGLTDLGWETIPSPHPVVPLMVRDTDKTTRLVRYLRQRGVLATGLNYPVVPKGDQLIRFQVSGEHTAADIDEVLAILAEAPVRPS